MEPTAFALLARIHLRTDGADHTTPALREAVGLLTAAAAPARAERLLPREGEAPNLVARLAVWALRRVDASTIAAAAAVLDRDDAGADAPTLLDDLRVVPVRAPAQPATASRSAPAC